MLAGVSRRLHGLVHDVEDYALHSGLQRVIGFLLRDQALGDCEPGAVRVVSLPVSKAHDRVAPVARRRSFSRVLHELEAHGLIEIDRRDIRILDAQRLSAYQLADA